MYTIPNTDFQTAGRSDVCDAAENQKEHTRGHRHKLTRGASCPYRGLECIVQSQLMLDRNQLTITMLTPRADHPLGKVIVKTLNF